MAGAADYMPLAVALDRSPAANGMDLRVETYDFVIEQPAGAATANSRCFPAR
jgi:hypothetical protein